MLLLKQNHAKIGQSLAGELADVESRFTQELASDLDCVNALINHIERYRGKMLRPMLVLVSGMASSPTARGLTDPHRVVATVAEMVHMATLVHDDVLDDAHVRRRSTTINYLRGNEAAVMLGDYLISHAYHLCSSLDQTRCCRTLADATNTVCEGELLQLDNRANLDLDEDTYFQIIGLKTASFCGTCCKLGAMINNAPAQTVNALYAYGEKLGLAYQIVDDILDITGTEDTVGKTLGRDLDKGKLTLPLIHTLATTNAQTRQTLLDLLNPTNNTDPPPDRADRVRDIILNADALDYANARAQQLIQQAQQTLLSLEDSPSRTLLQDMANAVLSRKF